jgi:parvulin-like peptidyl-prolyl isomerase
VRWNFAKMGEAGWEEADKERAWTVQDEMYEQRQIEDLLRIVIRRPKDATMREVKRYIKEHAEEFRRPDQVRLRQIVVNSATMVEAVADAIEAGESFTAITRGLGISSGTTRQLKWLGEGDLPAEIWEAVRDLKPGRRAGPVQTPYGAHFVYVRARREAGALSFKESAEIVSARIARERRGKAVTKYVARLRKRAKIRIDMTAVAAL